MLSENHILTKDEIKQYNKEGHNLDDSKTYIIKFLFNDKWNDAADPRPYRVKTSLIQKLAKDSIDMPYVVKPNDNTMHLRGIDEGKDDTTKALLEIQAKYSVGLIKVPIIRPNNNVYGIIEMWPEYSDPEYIEKLPAFTSATLAPLKEDADGIEDAMFLNLNGVDSPGYPRALAGVHGVCKGGIKECVAELSPLGAAGKLKAARENEKIFLNNLKSLSRSMSADQATMEGNQTPKPEPSLTEIAEKIDTVQTTVEEVKAVEEKVVENVENNNEVLKEVATVTEGVDENKVQEKIEKPEKVETPTPDTPPATPPVGASGSMMQLPKELENHPFVKGLATQVTEFKSALDEIKKEQNNSKQKQENELRKAQAESIVQRLIFDKQIKPTEKDAKVQEYINLKNEKGELENLTILDNYLKSKIPDVDESTPVGASGYGFPSIRGDSTEKPMSNAEAMGYDA